MNKWSEILLGLVLIIAVILAAFYFPSFWSASVAVFKGGLMWAVLGVGILLVMLGVSELKG